MTIDYQGKGTVALEEALLVAVMEATVHLLDLLRALSRPPEVPQRSLELTGSLVAEMPPAVELIEAAAGGHQLAPSAGANPWRSVFSVTTRGSTNCRR